MREFPWVVADSTVSKNSSWCQPAGNSFRIIGVDHKLGHYTGYRILFIANYRNNNINFLPLKFHHKMADVMIKPELSLQVVSTLMFSASAFGKGNDIGFHIEFCIIGKILAG